MLHSIPPQLNFYFSPEKPIKTPKPNRRSKKEPVKKTNCQPIFQKKKKKCKNGNNGRKTNTEQGGGFLSLPEVVSRLHIFFLFTRNKETKVPRRRRHGCETLKSRGRDARVVKREEKLSRLFYRHHASQENYLVFVFFTLLFFLSSRRCLFDKCSEDIFL